MAILAALGALAVLATLAILAPLFRPYRLLDEEVGEGEVHHFGAELLCNQCCLHRVLT